MKRVARVVLVCALVLGMFGAIPTPSVAAVDQISQEDKVYATVGEWEILEPVWNFPTYGEYTHTRGRETKIAPKSVSLTLGLLHQGKKYECTTYVGVFEEGVSWSYAVDNKIEGDSAKIHFNVEIGTDLEEYGVERHYIPIIRTIENVYIPQEVLDKIPLEYDVDETYKVVDAEATVEEKYPVGEITDYILKPHKIMREGKKAVCQVRLSATTQYSHATRYEVQYGQDKNFKKNIISKLQKSGHDVSMTCRKAGSYYWRVRVVRELPSWESTRTLYGEWKMGSFGISKNELKLDKNVDSIEEISAKVSADGIKKTIVHLFDNTVEIEMQQLHSTKNSNLKKGKTVKVFVRSLKKGDNDWKSSIRRRVSYFETSGTTKVKKNIKTVTFKAKALKRGLEPLSIVVKQGDKEVVVVWNVSII